MPPRGRPKKSKNDVKELVAVRLTPDLVDAIEAYVEEVRRTELPLLEFTRAAAIRYLLQAGLKAEGERLKKKGSRSS